MVVHETGGPEVLRCEQVERPDPAAAEVLIRVPAASVNPVDWKYRRGNVDRELPAVLGNDVSGTVELSRAEGFAPGDEVCGLAASGGYAEFATAEVGGIAHKPADLTHEQAAAIPVSGLTAWQALFEGAALERGQTVLIAGAAGGVGHLAVQLARLGGGRVIDYTQQDVAEAVSGVDVAFDTVGGETTRSLLGVVSAEGTLVSIAYPKPGDWAATEEAARRRGSRAALVAMEPRSGAAGPHRRPGGGRQGPPGDRGSAPAQRGPTGA